MRANRRMHLHLTVQLVRGCEEPFHRRRRAQHDRLAQLQGLHPLLRVGAHPHRRHVVREPYVQRHPRRVLEREISRLLRCIAHAVPGEAAPVFAAGGGQAPTLAPLAHQRCEVGERHALLASLVPERHAQTHCADCVGELQAAACSSDGGTALLEQDKDKDQSKRDSRLALTLNFSMLVCPMSIAAMTSPALGASPSACDTCWWMTSPSSTSPSTSACVIVPLTIVSPCSDPSRRSYNTAPSALMKLKLSPASGKSRLQAVAFHLLEFGVGHLIASS